MSYVCEICEKKNVHGFSQQHGRGVAGKRWQKRAPRTSRIFRVNLQRVTLRFNGAQKKMRICTKCLKRIKKYGSIKTYKNVAVV
ncbi:hypothetical protein A2115_01320 [Candidatus Woesebacteria bacterium GWA1_41_8]|uniref:50S ribosomal protein L28 n=1 Tax=Candidatus Woesebacteria bacterium GWA1_41_8 TaxID=1802471 RepID=A0A1F7WJQ5_9BACT|nr:MAG: hypothetical protein A2115_01320 [Candidatus Woesebacteria bacterium GWA1_41_8]